MARFIIRPRGRSIRPGDDFIDQMRLHTDDAAEEMGFVPCPDTSTDYEHLSDEQLRYYLYWREQLRTGNLIEGDFGYEYIRICELINLPEERHHALDEICLLIDAKKGVRISRSDLITLAFDICMVFGLPMRYFEGYDDVRSISLRSLALSFPISYIDRPDRFCDNPLPRDFYEYIEDGTEFFNKALRALDSYLVNTTGSGILDTYGGEMMSTRITPFAKYFYEGEKDYQLRYKDSSGNSQLLSFIGAVLRYFIGIECKADGKKGPSVSSILTKEMRSVIDREYRSKSDPYPEGEKYLDAIPMSESSENGMLIIPEFRIHSPKNPNFKADIERYRNIESDVHAPYVPSNCVDPQYADLSPEQMRFYLFWKTQVRNGNYPTTDLGYVCLYLCELINSQDDPDDTYDMILKLGEAYRGSIIRGGSKFFGYHQDYLIMRTALDYAIVNGLKYPTYEQYPCNITVNESMFRLLSGENLSFAPQAVAFFTRAEGPLKKNIDLDVSQIFTKALYAASRGQDNNDLATIYCRVSMTSDRTFVYDDLRYFGYPDDRRVKYAVSFHDYGNNITFEQNCRILLREVVGCVKDRRSGRKSSKHEMTLFGKRFADLDSIVEDYYARSPKKHVNHLTLKLDKDVIESAQQALDSTTEMMYIGDDIDDDIQIKKSEGSEQPHIDSSASGWEGFSQALDQEQMKALEEMLNGNKRIRPSIIDSINELSIEYLSDTVIEDGDIIFDYIEEIRRIVDNCSEH